MRLAVVIAFILLIMVLLAGCGSKVPTRNATPTNPWGTTPKVGGGGTGPGGKITIVPTTTSPFQQVPVSPIATQTPAIPIISPPPPANLTENLTVIDEKTLIFVYNRTAYNYNLVNPPLLIEITLTVPNITRTRVERDPTSSDPNADRTVTLTYPDPLAFFEVTITDVATKHVIARNGYGGQYDVSYSKKVWVRYPGTYIIEFSGNRLTADVRFLIPKE